MKIKALISFTGLETMFAGEVKEVKDEIARDLIRAGYAIEYEADKKGKKPVSESVEKPVEKPEVTVEEKKTSKNKK